MSEGNALAAVFEWWHAVLAGAGLLLTVLWRMYRALKDDIDAVDRRASRALGETQTLTTSADDQLRQRMASLETEVARISAQAVTTETLERHLVRLEQTIGDAIRTVHADIKESHRRIDALLAKEQDRARRSSGGFGER